MPTSASTSSRRRAPEARGDRLARAARDLVAYVSAFAAGELARELSPTELRNQLLALLDRLGKGTDARADELDEARFALVAWADEVVLRSNWRGRDEWAAEPLQLRLYRTNRAGNEFFEHLRRLRPEATRAREVYFLVLCLGFEGAYHDQPAERRALIAHQYETLRAARAVLESDRERYVTPSAYALEIELPRRGGGQLVRMGVVLGVALVVVYAVAWTALQFLATDVPLPRGL